MEGLVNKIIDFSFVDGPGNRMAIFLQGCNFNCINCHNPQTINLCNHCGDCIEGCSGQALVQQEGKTVYNPDKCIGCDKCLESCPNKSTPKAGKLTVAQIMDRIIKMKPFIQGITLSGGECTTQLDFILELFKEVKAKTNLTTFLDSNGLLATAEWQRLMEHTDGVMLDIKAYHPQTYRLITGDHGSLVFDSARFLAQHQRLYEVRTLVIPGLTDKEEEIKGIASFVASLSPNIQYKLLAFRPYGVKGGLSTLRSPGAERMERLAEVARRQGLRNVSIK